MNTHERIPCPFCQCQETVLVHLDYSCCVRCIGCEAEGPPIPCDMTNLAEKLVEAVRRWNQRAKL